MLTSATIFTDRARLTRVQKVALTVGTHKVDFTDLPLTILPASLRATGKGSATAKLLGVTSRQENYADTPAEAVRALEQQLLQVIDADAEASARASVLEKERAALEALALQNETWARGMAWRGRTAQEQGELLDFVSARMHKLNNEILKIIRERRDLAKEKDRLERELKVAQAARPRQRLVATVELEVQQAGELEVALTYILTGASWSPLYDLRLAQDELEVTYFAQVKQNTGEDWSNISLALSTAQPSLALNLPELEPWYLQVRSEVTRAAPPKAQAKGAIPVAPAAAPAPLMREAFDTYALAADDAAVSPAGASLTYQLSARADIKGNNEPRKVVIATFTLKPVLDYVTAPKQEPVCFRRAKLKNESRYALLPGPAQLFEDDDYLGNTTLEFIAAQQEFELTLGPDERLRVERELTLRETDKTFMSDKRRIRYGYKLEVENLREVPQTVLIRDQIPVARDEQIKVKLENAEPKITTQSDLNQLEWKLTLNAKTKQILKYEFSVEYPTAVVVLGLP